MAKAKKNKSMKSMSPKKMNKSVAPKGKGDKVSKSKTTKTNN